MGWQTGCSNSSVRRPAWAGSRRVVSRGPPRAACMLLDGRRRNLTWYAWYVLSLSLLLYLSRARSLALFCVLPAQMPRSRREIRLKRLQLPPKRSSHRSRWSLASPLSSPFLGAARRRPARLQPAPPARLHPAHMRRTPASPSAIRPLQTGYPKEPRTGPAEKLRLPKR